MWNNGISKGLLLKRTALNWRFFPMYLDQIFQLFLVNKYHEVHGNPVAGLFIHVMAGMFYTLDPLGGI
jgi:hypothetical protein